MPLFNAWLPLLAYQEVKHKTYTTIEGAVLAWYRACARTKPTYGPLRVWAFEIMEVRDEG